MTPADPPTFGSADSPLQQRADELAALYRLAALLAGQAELQEILNTATRELVHTLGLRAAGLRLLDEDSGVLEIASTHNLSGEYLDKADRPAAESVIDSAALLGEQVYVADLRTDPRSRFPAKARREGLVSMWVTRLAFGGRALGVLRAYTGTRHEFTAFERSLLEGVASLVASAVVHARLQRDARESARLERQVRLAAEVQRRMIPAQPPAHDRYRFGCIYEPTGELGGDFYDFSRLPDGGVGMVIADVVGKGVPASLLMAGARSALRSHAETISDVAELAAALNRRLCRDTLPSEFVTACLCIFDKEGKRLTWTNAGHEPPILLRRGRIKVLDEGGIALGILPDTTYRPAGIDLRPGDLLVTCTDGLVDAMNYDGKSFGRDRLYDSIRLYGSLAEDLPADFIAKQLLWDVRRYAGLAAMHDDITCVAVRVVGT